MKTLWLSTSLMAGSLAPVLAVLPAPDHVLYGLILVGGKTVAPTNPPIIVEARRTPTGPALVRYQVGSSPSAANFSYTLNLPLEELPPPASSSTFQLGDTIVLALRNQSGVLLETNYTIAERGVATRLDFAVRDADANGLPDDWEQRYFGLAGQNPGADPDRDGLTLGQEYWLGLSPVSRDARHPADMTEDDNYLTIHEVTAYASAFVQQHAWPLDPAVIPSNYVSQATALWHGGEYYQMDTNAATSAPTWWINVPAPVPPPSVTNALATSNNVVRKILPDTYLPGKPLGITNQVSPDSTTTVYAFEDQVPQGWIVAQITENGRFDSANHKVKWGPFFDAAERTLAYQLTPATNAAGPARLAATGSFDGQNGLLLGTDEILCQINHAPVAGDDAFTRPQNLPLVITEAQLLANDSDLEGGPLDIKFVDQTSLLGVPLTYEGNHLTYAPPAGMNENDAFAYFVADDQGKLATGKVIIAVDTQLPFELSQVLYSLDIVPLPQGGVRLSFQGVPLRTYEIQATADLIQPDWTILGTGVSQENGLLEFEDPEATQYPMRFYRALGQ